mgnify:CR=1 FL=1
MIPRLANLSIIDSTEGNLSVYAEVSPSVLGWVKYTVEIKGSMNEKNLAIVWAPNLLK